MSRICEEFPCLSPSTAYEEWQRLPAGFLEEVIEARHYAAAKRLVEDAPVRSNLPQTEMVQLATVIELELEAARQDDDG